MRAVARTIDGAFALDLESEEVEPLDDDASLFALTPPAVSLPLLVAAAAEGPTVIALLDRRPPLAVSTDGGRTWREAGGGLPPGRAVAIAPGGPDLVLYGARNRLYVSEDGGRFWRVLAAELPEIVAVAWLP